MTDEGSQMPERSGYWAFAYRVSTISGWIAGLALVCICALVTTEIVLRGISGGSTMIAEEMSGYLNVAVVFFGLSFAMTRGGFIRVSIIYDSLAGIAKRIVDWYIVLASLVYFLIVLYFMVKYTLYSYNFGIISTYISATPQFIPQSVIIVGSIGLILVFIGYIIDRCRNIP